MECDCRIEPGHYCRRRYRYSIQPPRPLSTKLLGGYNFVANNTNWNDDNGNGTHVGGIAGAINNNNIGIAGTSPLCRLLPVKTHNSQGTATLDNAARGIVYASNRGAHIINMSWCTTGYAEILEQACAYAWNRGSVFVAAAGNSSTNVYNYPAAFAPSSGLLPPQLQTQRLHFRTMEDGSMWLRRGERNFKLCVLFS